MRSQLETGPLARRSEDQIHHMQTTLNIREDESRKESRRNVVFQVQRVSGARTDLDRFPTPRPFLLYSGRSTTSSPCARSSPSSLYFHRSRPVSSPSGRDDRRRVARTLSNPTFAGFVQGFVPSSCRHRMPAWSRRIPSECRCRVSRRGDR